MREHARRNEIWDESQLGASEGVLGMVEQLLIDKCIMDEVREGQEGPGSPVLRLQEGVRQSSP